MKILPISLLIALTGCNNFYETQVSYLEIAPTDCEFVSVISDVAKLGYEQESIKRLKIQAYSLGANTIYYQFPEFQEIELTHGESGANSSIYMQVNAYICGKL
ncbi:hypothetical protein Q4519_02895 [Motilimonas sp. 1_MG-2023]|uniref:hypothetical protein n=1 Tax=Motilimonas sp. 1_MG-2023 TaxID=3062672 RepID=UPI0026E28593|nr:hypothetical protein [Motilimonas sp. 1_MG-2023]MDO6524623.1 hypothetical protein [Motilimonas sp. 1_MG-2023]